MDLTLKIEKGVISTKLFEKALNLYLYIPPSSSHPPGCIKGIIFGMVYRIYSLTDNKDNIKYILNAFLQRLLRRGYSDPVIRPIMNEGIERYSRINTLPVTTEEKQPVKDYLILHLPYHPQGPQSKAIQQLFYNAILQPSPRDTHLSTFLDKTKNPMGINRLIIAYSRQKNLKNLLVPRCFDKTAGPPASFYSTSNKTVSKRNESKP